MILPMLAKPLPTTFVPQAGRHVAEVKYDGRRMMVEVTGVSIAVWSRTGKDGMKYVSTQMRRDLALLPNGIYDGELVAIGGKHYDVSRLENISKLQYVVFDLVSNGLASLHPIHFTTEQWERRAYLKGVFDAYKSVNNRVHLAEEWKISSRSEIFSLAEDVWSRGGEGLMVKDIKAHYRPGKRTDAWYKVKLWQPVVVTVIGFEPSKGELVDRGPCGITVVRDSEGIVTRLKTLDDDTCRQAEQGNMVPKHPWIGRSLCCEYTSRTPDGLYENIKWDHWEDE